MGPRGETRPVRVSLCDRAGLRAAGGAMHRRRPRDHGAAIKMRSQQRMLADEVLQMNPTCAETWPLEADGTTLAHDISSKDEEVTQHDQRGFALQHQLVGELLSPFLQVFMVPTTPRGAG